MSALAQPLVYDPKSPPLLPFSDQVIAAFADGRDTPRAFLERCLDMIAEREPAVLAFVYRDDARARKAADAATERYKNGRSLS